MSGEGIEEVTDPSGLFLSSSMIPQIPLRGGHAA